MAAKFVVTDSQHHKTFNPLVNRGNVFELFPPKKEGQIIPSPVRTEHDDERRRCVSSAWVWAGEKRWIKMYTKSYLIKNRVGWLTCSPFWPLCSRWAAWSFSRLRMLGSAPLLSSSLRISSWWGLPWRPAAMCKAVWPWACSTTGKGSVSPSQPRRGYWVFWRTGVKARVECVTLTFRLTKSFMLGRGVLSR